MSDGEESGVPSWVSAQKVIFGKKSTQSSAEATDRYLRAVRAAVDGLAAKDLHHALVQEVVAAYSAVYPDRVGGVQGPVRLLIDAKSIEYVCGCFDCGRHLIPTYSEKKSTSDEAIYSRGVDRMTKRIPALQSLKLDCPEWVPSELDSPADSSRFDSCEGMGSTDLFSVIMHLNDDHRWTRERIADWLDELTESGVDLSFKPEDSA